MTQVYAATSACLGTYSPSEALDGIIMIEAFKALAHFWTETNIPRRLFRLKQLNENRFINTA